MNLGCSQPVLQCGGTRDACHYPLLIYLPPLPLFVGNTILRTSKCGCLTHCSPPHGTLHWLDCQSILGYNNIYTK